MKLLGWDTSSAHGLVAAAEVVNGTVVVRAELKLSLHTAQHSERLLWSIDQILHSVGWNLSDVSFLVVGQGPGSFTGLRIGIATAKGLADTLGIPIVPTSSLKLLTKPAHDLRTSLGKKWTIWAASDAAKGEVFVLRWGRAVSEKILTPHDLVQRINGLKGKWALVGPLAERFNSLGLKNENRIHLPDSISKSLFASALFALAYEKIQAEDFVNSDAFMPNYMRDSDAEVQLRKKNLKT